MGTRVSHPAFCPLMCERPIRLLLPKGVLTVHRQLSEVYYGYMNHVRRSRRRQSEGSICHAHLLLIIRRRPESKAVELSAASPCQLAAFSLVNLPRLGGVLVRLTYAIKDVN